MTNKNNNSYNVRRLTFISIFCALAYVCSVVLPIKVAFLTLDFKDAVSTMCGMFFGPVAGLFCAITVPFIELITSDTGVYGLIMNLLSSITFVGVSTVIYKYKKTITGAVLGLFCAALATVAVMLLANLFITPYYMGVERNAVVQLIPKLILPFNTIKTLLNAGISMLIYKPLSNLLKKTKVRTGKSAVSIGNSEKAVNVKRSVIVSVISAVVIVVAFVILFTVLGGKLDF